jgi:hypothetical protein
MTYRTLLFSLSLLLGCGAPVEAPPASDSTDVEAESCLRPKIWEAGREGWSVRNSGTERVSGQAFRSFAVNLYSNREYQLMACGAGWAQEVGLQLYTKAGDRVKASDGVGRQPVFVVKPPLSASYFVVVQNRTGHEKTGSINWALLYR